MGKLDELELIEPASREQWRAWLEAHHASSPGVWLAIGKKGNSRTTLTYDGAVEEALCFGWIDSTVRRLDDERYQQLLTPRKPSSMWSRSNKERVERLLAEGCMTPAGLAAIQAAKANGSWETLTEIDALTVPDDLAAALAATPGAAEGFSALAASQRKMALYWVGAAKRSETRAARIERVVAAAREGRPPV